ncbi:MAG: WYL domain-containing protein [Eubacteriales bacterium]
MLFHEIYGCYYNAVVAVLSSAVKGTLTETEMKRIVIEKAFAESFLTILPSLEKEQWQLLDSSLHTPLKREPSVPLTILQKRWLKAISLDPRIKLFGAEFDLPDDIQPLFTPDDYVVFDQYNDGDNYEDEKYIKIFRTVLDAIHTHKKLKVQYAARKGNFRTIICVPYQLEYSEKDDKFRVLLKDCRYADIINVSRIKECEMMDIYAAPGTSNKKINTEYFIMEITDERNALERVMLHFAHFEKEAERVSENKYRMKIRYNGDDETELVIRVLSFGPFVKITEPAAFVGLIKERLVMQKSCGLK